MNTNQRNEKEQFLENRKPKITKISDKTIETLKFKMNWEGIKLDDFATIGGGLGNKKDFLLKIITKTMKVWEIFREFEKLKYTFKKKHLK